MKVCDLRTAMYGYTWIIFEVNINHGNISYTHKHTNENIKDKADLLYAGGLNQDFTSVVFNHQLSQVQRWWVSRPTRKSASSYYTLHYHSANIVQVKTSLPVSLSHYYE